MTSIQPVIGLIGLGTMGTNLALNFADNGYPIAVFNRTTSKSSEFKAGAGALADMVFPSETIEAFLASLQKPRNIILMVPAGAAVDRQIETLLPLLDDDDLIIDAGNAQFDDTNRRAAALEERGGPNFLGLGVSGGAEGARFGPSMMGGGNKTAWDRVAPMLEKVSASYEGTPCATWMGKSGSGHFVKMVHNGIEYADMQMIAEIYGLMRDGLELDAKTIGQTFAEWNEGPLKSYLIEITSRVSSAVDEATGGPVLDVILDKAGQKGTGRWTAIEALKLGSPVTVIDAAVAARNYSSVLEERQQGERIFAATPPGIAPSELSNETMEQALLAGKIACYAQGFGMLDAASKEYDWGLPMSEIAKVWREGCIIRSDMLNDMAQALSDAPGTNLMYAPYFAEIFGKCEAALRTVIGIAVSRGHATPALSAALAYFDTMRKSRGTANMIQAQRDFFGAHSFERIGEEGAHHGPWGAQQAI